MSYSKALSQEYYRSDGVRITHDPYAPGIMEKYGKPGETDNEGFDPYRDSVGPGIYGGIVKRNEFGEIIIGKQYQNHNPRPGPVYAGGGYAPISDALRQGEAENNNELRKLLDKYPDLVNDITTGGAQPLHMCGMSQRNQFSTKTLINYGADIEALDTYGMTPLHRMASNNLPIGAKALLEAGADPNNQGLINTTPKDIARQSRAYDVIKVLDSYKFERVPIFPSFLNITVNNVNTEKLATDTREITGKYMARQADTIPFSFDKVCKQQGWNTSNMWDKLNGSNIWYQHIDNGSYVYFNKSDRKWWIDGTDGLGMFTHDKGFPHTVPANGWVALRKNNLELLPSVRCFRSEEK